MTDPRTAVVYVGAMDDARVDGVLASYGFRAVSAVDPSMFPAQRPACAVVDPDAFGGDPVRATSLASRRLQGAPLVLLSGRRSREELVQLISLDAVVAVVPRDHISSDSELDSAIRAIARGPTFGLKVPANQGLMEAGLGSSREREVVLERLAEFLSLQGVRRRLASMLVDATEELITNAVYDAPTDEAGRRIYSEIDRRHAVFLPEAARPIVRATVSRDEGIVAVYDPHGSIDIRTVKRFIAKGLTSGPSDHSEKLGGAGLGLARVFAMVDRLEVHVRTGVASEITLALSIRGSRRDMAARPTSLLLVEDDP